jgi:hypothetical protein
MHLPEAARIAYSPLLLDRFDSARRCSTSPTSGRAQFNILPAPLESTVPICVSASRP